MLVLFYFENRKLLKTSETPIVSFEFFCAKHKVEKSNLLGTKP